MKTKYVVSGCLLGMIGVAALAQDMSGISLDDINKRMGEYADEAAVLVNGGEEQRKTVEEEVKPLVEQAQGSIANADVDGIDGIENADLDALANGVSAQLKEGNSHKGVVAFVSLSMPKDSLKKLMQDMTKAGGFVIFQGFPDNNVTKFKVELSKVLGQEQNIRNVGIDPRMFQAFKVKNVPTYVALDGPLKLCTQLECESSLPAHDIMQGNVPVAYALETFANGGGSGARSAKAALAQYEAQR